jgi:Tfp pilus assembly pilus retraction ATPase PilT
MNLQEYINRATQLQAHEVLFATGATPRARVKGNWFNMSEKKMSGPEIRKFFVSWLKEDDLERLTRETFLEGYNKQENKLFFYQMQLSLQGLQVQLSWLPENLRQMDFWGFPLWTKESLCRGVGLHILTSKSSLALHAAATALIQEINQQDQKFIVWQKRRTLAPIESEQSVVSYIDEGLIPEAADIVILEGLHSMEKAFSLSEKGQAVLWLLNIHGSLNQSLEKLSGEELSLHLKWAMQVKMIHGLEGWVPAFDLLAAVEPVKELLKKKDLKALDALMEKTFAQTGMRTMNQSLLQLVLKRKIDFKQGFVESSEPEKFDQLLKKVGI